MALKRLAMMEAIRVGDEALARGYVTDEDAAYQEQCEAGMFRAVRLEQMQGDDSPPPVIAAALAEIPIEEVA